MDPRDQHLGVLKDVPVEMPYCRDSMLIDHLNLFVFVVQTKTLWVRNTYLYLEFVWIFVRPNCWSFQTNGAEHSIFVIK